MRAAAPFEAATRTAARARKITEVTAWLHAAMQDGKPRGAAEMEAAGRAAGFTHTTLQRGKERLHIVSRRHGPTWVWVPAKRRQPKKQAIRI